MLLNDLPGPQPAVQQNRSYSTLPSKFVTKAYPPAPNTVGGSGDPLQSLQAEERALKGQLTSLNDKREKLAGELEGLISQVSHMTIT